MCVTTGKPTPVTWTVLAETVAVGATEIKLQIPVTWSVGDEIIIASTGGHTSQKENEKRTIKTISSDTMTLTEALKYDHLGETQTFEGGFTLETRAEVGLLTHNVVVRGSNLKDWNDKIEACPVDFDPGKSLVKNRLTLGCRFCQMITSENRLTLGCCFYQMVTSENRLTLGCCFCQMVTSENRLTLGCCFYQMVTSEKRLTLGCCFCKWLHQRTG